MAQRTKRFDYDNISPQLKSMRYEVRGTIYLAAQERVKSGKEVIFTNVGNPHGLGQVPLSFIRQVLALVVNPPLMDEPGVQASMPPDVLARAKQYLAALGHTPANSGGVGTYTDSKGAPALLRECADFVQERDGIPCSLEAEPMFFTNGASEGVKACLMALLVSTSKPGMASGVMCPVPQYPLYSASAELYGGKLVPYYLDEERGWSLDFHELERAYEEAKSNGIDVKALVFINPGNPTGNCLTQSDLQALARFAHRNNIVLMADEVYQGNIFGEVPFTSMRSVLHSMGGPCSTETELVSFHTTSKGFYGECGLRGGYFQCTNIDGRAIDELYKHQSISLAPGAVGQVAMTLVCRPPKQGDPSYATFLKESTERNASLARRAKMVTDAFNSCEGITCQPCAGAMYSFPRLHLPAAAIAAAEAEGLQPDVFYCKALLDATGISTVPGSGFQQKPGTFHFRTTILPPEDRFPLILASFKEFHANFMKKYATGRARL